MDAHCPQCGELGVDCDGQSVCQGCGFVLSDASYVPETGAEGQQIGQHISANGRVPGEVALQLAHLRACSSCALVQDMC